MREVFMIDLRTSIGLKTNLIQGQKAESMIAQAILFFRPIR